MRAAAVLSLLLLAGCSSAPRTPPRAPREHPCLLGPPPPAAQQDGTAIPAWNVGGTIYVACGAGGKACGG